MARITHVHAARKAQRCEKCGKSIAIGQPYRWCAPRAHRAMRGYKRVRCATCPTWTAGELTTSKMGPIYDAQATFNPFDAATADDVHAMLSEFAQVVRDVADEYTQSADNIEEGFKHATSMSYELRQKGEDLTSWADEIEGVIVPDAPEEPEDGDDEDDNETAREDYENAMEEWRSDVEDACLIVQECPV